MGGLGRSPSCTTLFGVFGSKWNPFLNSFNTIFNPTCQTDKRRIRSLLLSGGGAGAEPQPPTLLGVFEYESNSFLNFVDAQFSTRRVRLASAEGDLSRYWGGGWRLGQSPSRQRLWETVGVNKTIFSIALTTFSTLLAPTAGMQPAARIVIE